MRIAVTGANGFIGSNFTKMVESPIYVNGGADEVDFRMMIGEVDAVVHLAAITDTQFKERYELERVNVQMTKALWAICVRRGIPFVYASSGSVYGDGRNGFKEDAKLWPLNLYAESKALFDEWTASQKDVPPFWYGMRFFNVYGRGEESKGKMASQVHQTIQRVKDGLNPRFFAEGNQRRDFVYVGDCIQHILHLLNTKAPSGIYNSGTGMSPRSFNELGAIVCAELGKEVKIEHFPMPDELNGKFQEFTCSDITKIRGTGYREKATSLESGIKLVI